MNDGEESALFLVKLCSDRISYEAIIKRKVAFDMEKVKQVLESRNFAVLLYTPHMIILRNDRSETTLSRDGRMLIRRVKNEEDATEVAHELLDTLQETIIH
jgi:TATA-box binding protein (TBP) (component of TFIID and TFIIIB)